MCCRWSVFLIVKHRRLMKAVSHGKPFLTGTYVNHRLIDFTHIICFFLNPEIFNLHNMVYNLTIFVIYTVVLIINSLSLPVSVRAMR